MQGRAGGRGGRGENGGPAAAPSPPRRSPRRACRPSFSELGFVKVALLGARGQPVLRCSSERLVFVSPERLPEGVM